MGSIDIKEVHFNFIGNYASEEPLDDLRHLTWEQGTVACTRHTWVWPLYCQMKMQGFRVSFSYEPREDAVNIIHCQIARGCLKASDFRRYYFIGIRADYPAFPYGQFEIVQNKLSEKPGSVYMPLFPQPGLIKRDVNRAKIENVCFSGRAQNSIDLTLLESELAKIGCNLIFKAEGAWHEMQDVDILLGIRSFSKEAHVSKPPTKLFNAWLAGIPFIGGYDSAFEQVGEPGRNYLRVSTMDEMIRNIEHLRDDPSWYSHLVREGFSAAKEYTPESITNKWIAFFEETVLPHYAVWQNKGLGIRVDNWRKSLHFACCVQAKRRLMDILK